MFQIKNKLIQIILVLFSFSNLVLTSDKALQDLDIMYQTILENHPGPYNYKDPDFTKNMDQAYQQAKNNVVNVCTQQEAFKLLDMFAQSFCDQHLCIYSVDQKDMSQIERIPQVFAIKDFTSDISWITMPNFEPTKQEQEQLELLIEELPKLRIKKCIIFDLRGNGGGSSLWGTRILESLFTKDYVSQKFTQAYFDSYEDFRVSKSNLEYWKDMESYFESSFGKNSKEYHLWQQLTQGMQKAYDKQQVFYRMKEMTERLVVLPEITVNPCSAKIFVIIDSGCFSSCLTFIHELQTINKNITLIGQKTAINTAYMEIREDVLPSGIRFRYPTAVGRNSKPHFHFYVPDIAYPKDIKDKEAKQRWLEETIKNLN